MDNIITQMLILLLLVVAGFISNKCGLTGGDFDRKLSNFIINVSCPCLILSSVMGDTIPDGSLIVPLLLVGFVTYAVLFGVSWLLPRYFVRQADIRGMYSFMLMFGNVGFIGYPVVASIFGHAPAFTSSTITFMPRFVAAFCVLRRVRRLLLKNIISRVLFLPSCWYLYLSCFISFASAKAPLRPPRSSTLMNVLIVV